MAFFTSRDSFILSPSDLTSAGQCEYAWLRHIDAQLGRIPALTEEDPLLDTLARLGDAHEARHLEGFRAHCGTDNVTVIPRPDPYTPEGLARAAARTETALQARTPVIAQAAFFDGGFAGFADFLILTQDGRYEVWDAKLARHARVTALLQISAYADQLDRLGIPRSEYGTLLLGDDSTFQHSLTKSIPVYRARRAQLESLLREHLTESDPITWRDARVTACGACPHCAEAIQATDDLFQIATMSSTQRQRLIDAGVTTLTELARATRPTPGIALSRWSQLHAQAQLQLAAREHAGAPPVELLSTEAIRSMPSPDPGDVFFDFEGDPLWAASGGTMDGLEYLFGVVDLTANGAPRYLPLWAHDRHEEREALIRFLDYVRTRRDQYPGMHIYHYASYEQTALKRLTVRHSWGEDFLDDLLRAGVFVDLYPIVRHSIRVGQPSYSIKKLEPLYMGDELRDSTGVTNAGDSVVEYHRFRAAVDAGDTIEADGILKRIADYNRYDCISTLRLRNWLMSLAPRDHATDGTASGIPVAGSDATEADAPSRSSQRAHELSDLAARLNATIPDNPAERSPEQQAVALVSAALGYYRREDKPYWWGYFGRFTDPPDQWQDTRSSALFDTVVSVGPWQRVGRARTASRELTVSAVLEEGSSIQPGVAVKLLYENLPEQVEAHPRYQREEVTSGKVLSVTATATGRATITLTEKLRTGMVEFPQLPMAMFVSTHVSAGPLEDAIADFAESILPEGVLPPSALSDLLTRKSPRLNANAIFRPGNTFQEAVETLTSMEDSYLAVQGPPGTGKTYLGSHVVAALIAQGWRVGVTAQSHAVIENFLRAVHKAGVDASRIVRIRNTAASSDDPFVTVSNAGQVPDTPGVVIGGTAWSFANPALEELDVLVIEEAGQFALAHTVAVSQAARRLLLLGDPQQLPQVVQGSHPEPIDSSALGWLIGDHDTMPPTRGYFLSRTRRMHSTLAAAVSRLAYGGRLRAVTEVTDSRRLHEVAPGLHAVPVPHRGNSVASPEEADALVGRIISLLGSPWSDGVHAERPLSAADVIVVAPYNAQVALLRSRLDRAGLTETPVGTVDRFQGKEAVIAMVSLASSGDGISRGLSFLLDEHRLNVAISRGQWASYLFFSPGLLSLTPESIQEVDLLGGFLGLIAP